MSAAKADMPSFRTKSRETKCDYNKITEKKAVRYTYDVTLSSKETEGQFIDTLVERKILFTFGIPEEKRQVRL